MFIPTTKPTDQQDIERWAFLIAQLMQQTGTQGSFKAACLDGIRWFFGGQYDGIPAFRTNPATGQTEASAVLGSLTIISKNHGIIVPDPHAEERWSRYVMDIIDIRELELYMTSPSNKTF